MTKSPQQVLDQAREEFVEKGAELEHKRWARWQNYLHTFLKWNLGGFWELSNEKKEHWDSQVCRPYAQLSEDEKESDRKETRNYLPLLDTTLQSFIEAEIAKEEGEVKERTPEQQKNIETNGDGHTYNQGLFNGYNQAKEETISHLTQLLVTLKR